MLEGEGIPEFDQLAVRVFGRIRLVRAVMQMNLDFTPAFVAMASQTLHQLFVVLLRRIEIRVTEGAPLMIAKPVNQQGIFSAPTLNPVFLHFIGYACTSVFRYDCRLKMVS